MIRHDMIRQDLTYLMGGVVNKGSSGLVSCIWRKSRGRLELSSETSFGRRDNEEVAQKSKPLFCRKTWMSFSWWFY